MAVEVTDTGSAEGRGAPDGGSEALREVAEIVVNRDGVYGDQLLALSDFLAGEFADEPLGAELAAMGWNR